MADVVSTKVSYTLSAFERDVLTDAWDAHLHAGPDVVPRVQRADDVLLDAQHAGMAGIVLKDHCGSTAAIASVLNAQTGSHGARAVGSITLNLPVGGFNPAAVEGALRLGARMVWAPTYSASHHIAVLGKSPFPGAKSGATVVIKDASGGLLSPVKETLKLIAEHDAVLGTGHLAPVESIELLREARSLGVRRLVLTHATLNVTAASLEVQREAVALGATVEHCMLALAPETRSCTEQEMVAHIREIGIEHIILTSDLGQPANGPIVKSFASRLLSLERAGLAFADLRRAITVNPAQLLF